MRLFQLLAPLVFQLSQIPCILPLYAALPHVAWITPKKTTIIPYYLDEYFNIDIIINLIP